MPITDVNGVPITFLSFDIPMGSDGPIFTVRIPAATGLFLKADSNSDLEVLAKRSGTGDAYVDIAVTPIDLSPFAGMNVDYLVKVHADAVAGLVSTAVQLKATFVPS